MASLFYDRWTMQRGSALQHLPRKTYIWSGFLHSFLLLADITIPPVEPTCQH